MSTVSLLRSGSRTLRTAIHSNAIQSTTAARVASTTFTRNKVTLPDLPYDYGALEPHISGQIMQLHHDKHHATYVNSYNDATEKLASATAAGQVAAQVALQPLINFHGGGHINHSLFWENLAPQKSGGGEPPSGKLGQALTTELGGLENTQKKINGMLAALQGSGWVWLVVDGEGRLGMRSYANQDPVLPPFKPLLGIDAWEHAYYLQYQNRKAEYFNAIWNVINWKTVEQRYQQAVGQ